VGFANVKWFGAEGDYRILVLDLLGPSLDDLFSYCSKRFSLKTVLMLADQILIRFEYLHARGYTHGSVKPANLLMGRNQCVDKSCYMIDFGRSKKYVNLNGVHIYFYLCASTYQGPFFSINACEGGAQSRRDDMQSVGYMLMYFLRGSLPWSTAKYNKRHQTKYLQTKKDTSVEDLCRGYPREFSEYFAHIASLGFEDRPDYAHLRGLFRALFEQQGFADDGMYDWSRPDPVSTARTSTAAAGPTADTTTPTAAAAIDAAGSTIAVPAADSTTLTAALTADFTFAATATAVAAPPTSTVTNPVVEVTMAAAVVATAFSTVSDPVVDASGPS
jgi:serine/threonine protein kinase